MDKKDKKILCVCLVDHPELLTGVATFSRSMERVFKKWGGGRIFSV